MEKTPIILYGAGGHCASVIDVIESTERYKIAYIIDDAPDKKNTYLCGYPIIGSFEDHLTQPTKITTAFITIGKVTGSPTRQIIFDRLKAANFQIPSIQSRFAIVSKYAQIGEGTIIMHGAIVNTNAIIQTNAIINTSALVEHDCLIGHNVHIATHATANGHVSIKDHSMIGSGAIINQGCSIPEKTLIGSGTVVNKSIETIGTYVGVPARLINSSK